MGGREIEFGEKLMKGVAAFPGVALGKVGTS
jgi:hypothetical protein